MEVDKVNTHPSAIRDVCLHSQQFVISRELKKKKEEEECEGLRVKNLGLSSGFGALYIVGYVTSYF